MTAIVGTQITNNFANEFGGLQPNSDPNNLYHNDQYDAYRHALVSAELTRLLGSELAKQKMDQHEADVPNPSNEDNMDRWNNRVGREEYAKWREAVDNGSTDVSLEKWIYDRVKDGTTINDPFSPLEDRVFEDREELETPSIPDRLWDQIKDSVNDFFRDAMNWFPRRDPLTLDLNGDGIKTLPADGQVLFDHNGDGIKEGTGWIAPTDGILVLDRNGNGTIDSGRELFGDNTLMSDGKLAKNGFEALADLDSNVDGLFDANDAQWSQVKIWKDANSDGISQASELFSLDTVNTVGIKQINLANTAGNINVGNGNVATANGTFVWNDGHTGAAESTASNLDLAANPFYREFTDEIAIPVDKLDLVDMFEAA